MTLRRIKIDNKVQFVSKETNVSSTDINAVEKKTK